MTVEKQQVKTENRERSAEGITEMVFLLDRSGSMSGMESDTIGGFNSMLHENQKTGAKVFVSTILFDHEDELLHDRLPIEEIPDMTEQDYRVRGNTALVDAAMHAILHIKKIHQYAREEDRPVRTLFVMITDGMENSSKKYTADQLREVIKKQEEKGWKFIFLGANIDAVRTAEGYGISRDYAAEYIADRAGFETMWGSVSKMTGAYSLGSAITPAWKKYCKRK